MMEALKAGGHFFEHPVYIYIYIYMLHWQQIRESGYQILPVSAHIAQGAKGKEMKFTVFPFHEISIEDDYERRAKEQHFIEKFKPTLNANL